MQRYGPGRLREVNRDRRAAGSNRWRRLVVLAVAIGFLFAQVATEITGSLDVAVRRIEFHSAELLEMGRLSVDEQFVDRGIARSSVSPRFTPIRTLESRCMVSSSDRLGVAEDAIAS